MKPDKFTEIFDKLSSIEMTEGRKPTSIIIDFDQWLDLICSDAYIGTPINRVSGAKCNGVAVMADTYRGPNQPQHFEMLFDRTETVAAELSVGG